MKTQGQVTMKVNRIGLGARKVLTGFMFELKIIKVQNRLEVKFFSKREVILTSRFNAHDGVGLPGWPTGP